MLQGKVWTALVKCGDVWLRYERRCVAVVSHRLKLGGWEQGWLCRFSTSIIVIKSRDRGLALPLS